MIGRVVLGFLLFRVVHGVSQIRDLGARVTLFVEFVYHSNWLFPTQIKRKALINVFFATLTTCTFFLLPTFYTMS